MIARKTCTLFLAVIIRLVGWYCRHALCGFKQFASTHSITTVVVIPKPDMPSIYVLTLYADTNPFSTSNSSIGPITSRSNPSVRIEPIRNIAANLFEANSAILISSVRNGLGGRTAPRGNSQEDWTGPDDNFYSVRSWDILGLQG